LTIIFPHKPGAGGPGSFQSRFERQILDSGWQVQYAQVQDVHASVIFVVGGTRRLWWLFQMKRSGVSIVFRLDGINWLHKKKKTTVRNFLLSEWRNLTTKFIHAFLADYIVYQSHFTKDWWLRAGWKKRHEFTVIYNAVDIQSFRPNNNEGTPVFIACMEGTLDYSPYAVELLNELRDRLPNDLDLRLYGRFESELSRKHLSVKIKYNGAVQREDVPKVLARSIYLSLDINPACPNTVVEALACGAPVVAFQTGALRELVPKDCGVIVPYGSDPWKLAMPDVDALVSAILLVNENYDTYSVAARSYAEKNYNMTRLFSEYREVIETVNAPR
jgi:glycosyltransferase involved in cell wall biosynthesis